MTKPLFEMFRDAVMRRPQGSRKEAQDWFVEKMKANPAYVEMLARDYFDRMSATWSPKKEEQGYSFGRTAPAAEKIERVRASREESRARTAAVLSEMKAKLRDIILLDIVMPNGKRLRDSTGAECERAGGFYSAIAKHLKPAQVVDRHLSEANLRDIRARYFQRNTAKAA